MASGRPSNLNDPEYAKLVAELWVTGVSRAEMASNFDVSPRTISTWVRDPRVQAHARTMAVERVQRITRKIDGEMEMRLAHIDEWALDEILKVRKEYLERPLKIGAGEDTELGKATNEIAEAMDESPDFAEQMMELVEASRAARKA